MRIALRLTLILMLLLMISTTAIAQSDPQSPEEIVAATYEAINAGDIEAYMALFADDAVVTVGPWYTFTGKDEIRASAQETFDANVTFEYEILEVEEGNVKTWSSHTPPDNDFPLAATEEFVIENGKIVFNSWGPTEETMALLDPSPADSTQPDAQSPEEIVLKTYAAINAADADAYVNLFAEDAVMTIGPWRTLTNHDEIRAFAQENFDADAQIEYEIQSVDNGLVTALTSLTSEAYDFPLNAIEKHVVADGKIVYDSWNPTAETIALLSGPKSGNDILQGVYGIALDGVFLATEDDTADTRFNMIGSFAADGEGNITEGARTLNIGGDIQTDTLDGIYIVSENDTVAITLNAFQNDELAAIEELTCFISIDGIHFECIVTAISVPAESGSVDVPLVGTAHGLRLME